MNAKRLVLLLAAAAIVAGGGLLWLRSPQTPSGSPPIRMARNLWPGQFWVDIAGAKGWFAEAGLNVVLVDTTPDYFASVKDLAEGRLDTNNLTLFDLVASDLKGHDLVMVLNTDRSNGVDGLVVREGTETPRQLRGRRVGVQRATYTEYILSVILARHGLTFKDVHLVEVKAEDTSTALAKGDVDAVMSYEPYISEAIKKGLGKKLLDTSKIPGISPSGLALRRNFVETRRKEVEKLLRVWARTQRFIEERPTEAFTLIAGIYHISVQEVQELAKLDTILGLEQNITAFQDRPGYDSLRTNAKNMLLFFALQGVEQKKLDINQLFDASFINQLR